MKQSFGGRGLSTEGDRSLDDVTPHEWDALHAALNKRGGEHYRKLDPQPWDVTLSWEAQGAIGHALATVIEYIARHQFKGDPKVCLLYTSPSPRDS